MQEVLKSLLLFVNIGVMQSYEKNFKKKWMHYGYEWLNSFQETE